MYKFFLKRIFDFILSFIGLVLLLPVIVCVAVFLLFANKGDVFFVQARPGLNTRSFNIIKFKTMNDRRDKEGNLLSDGERLTKVGSIIRKLSLDEILQLINVLKGDMSLIGPRPLLPDYLPFYNPKQQRRHEIRPGITGWAQVNGRNSISWAEKFDLDVYYVDEVSFKLDAKIMLLTIKKIFKPSDISPLGHATMLKFSDEVRHKA